MAADYDFIVIGGGTNGLTCASYLLREGYSVILVEKNNYLGGCAVSDEITLPGYKHDVLATSINIWRLGPVETELELKKYGYHDITPEVVASTPFRNGKAITIYRDEKRTADTISKFSKSDAKKYLDTYDYYKNASEIIEEGFSSSPMKYSEMMSLLEDSEDGMEFLRISFMSARDWLNENFESEEVKAFFSIWGSNHAPLSPEDAGSALTALTFVGLLQQKGGGIPIGGMQTLTKALATYITKHNGTFILGDPVTEIEIHDARATGVKLQSGRYLNAKLGIMSNVEPKALFNKLIPASKLSEGFMKKVKNFRYSSVTQVMIHAAMKKPLMFKPEETGNAGLVQIGETLDEVSQSFNQCVRGIIPEKPFMTLNNYTKYDKTRTPDGGHILWNFVRAPAKINGRGWNEEDKHKFAELSFDVLEQYASNVRESVLKMKVMSPQDIEAYNTNLVNGDPVLGQPSIDQMLSLRPFVGFSRYASEISNLYMCSAATHPGGGVSGLPGRNSALQAIENLKSSRRVL
jgi:phytoene dehydrogenase-like protein